MEVIFSGVSKVNYYLYRPRWFLVFQILASAQLLPPEVKTLPRQKFFEYENPS